MLKSFKLIAISILSLLWVSSFWYCRNPLESLEFVEVAMPDQPQRLTLDSVRLRAQFSGYPSGTPDAVGFLWSEDPSALLSPSGGGSVLPGRLVGGGSTDFETLFRATPGKMYYFRAFARLGERTSYSPQLHTFSFDLRVLVQYLRRNNNLATIAGQIIGLEAVGQKVSSHGHVFSSVNPFPEIGAPNCDTTNLGATNDDAIFASDLKNLNFNTRYYVRAYLILSSGLVMYSADTAHAVIEDGWRRVSDFPSVYQEGTAVAHGGYGYVGLGSAKNASVYFASDISTAYHRFDPNAVGGYGKWAPMGSMPGSLFGSNAVSFSVGDNIFWGFGEYYTVDLNANPDLFFLRTTRKYSTSDNMWKPDVTPPDSVPRRGEAVAFVLNGKAYIGTGRSFIPNTDIELNDFWEYNPDKGHWRKVAPMPYKLDASSPTLGTVGRREAVSFVLNGKGYVGGGASSTSFLSDFWEFIPPTSDQDLGRWEFAGFFPGLPRIDAVAFAVNGKAYYGTGYNIDKGGLSDFWEFDPNSNALTKWKNRTPFPPGRRERALGFGIGDFGYLGTGIEKRIVNNGNNVEYGIYNDMWQYIPAK